MDQLKTLIYQADFETHEMEKEESNHRTNAHEIGRKIGQMFDDNIDKKDAESTRTRQYSVNHSDPVILCRH